MNQIYSYKKAVEIADKYRDHLLHLPFFKGNDKIFIVAVEATPADKEIAYSCANKYIIKRKDWPSILNEAQWKKDEYVVSIIGTMDDSNSCFAIELQDFLLQQPDLAL